MSWMPPVSPWGLIQEQLWPSEWLILVSCIMLNCTSRKQVEKVLPTFMIRYPSPEAFISNFDVMELGDMIASLGFRMQRVRHLKQMTEAYLSGDWKTAKDLPGIGEYGQRCWEIFCRGTIGDTCPRDGALAVYWRWFKRQYHEEAS